MVNCGSLMFLALATSIRHAAPHAPRPTCSHIKMAVVVCCTQHVIELERLSQCLFVYHDVNGNKKNRCAVFLKPPSIHCDTSRCNATPQSHANKIASCKSKTLTCATNPTAATKQIDALIPLRREGNKNCRIMTSCFAAFSFLRTFPLVICMICSWAMVLHCSYIVAGLTTREPNQNLKLKLKKK